MSAALAAAAALLLVIAALWLAARKDRRARAAARQRADRARARAAVAAGLRAGIADEEVRAAWRVIVDALAQGWLGDADAVVQLRGRVTAGGGVQLMEEASIDVDDEAPAGDRVLLYHAGFDPPRATCRRGALVAELDRLVAALRSEARGAARPGSG